MKSYRKYLFWVFWGVMAVLTGLIYFRYDTNSDFIGLVENRTYLLGVQESGRVAAVTVAVGDQVRTGQVLVELDMTDLDREKAVLSEELDRLQEHLDADRARAGLEYDKLTTQSDADSLNMDMRKADLAEKAAELESVKVEIERLQAAERAGLGRSRELSDLIIRRDTLSRVVAAQRSVLGDRSPSGSRRDGGSRDRVVLSMLGDSLARIGEIKVALSLVESRRSMRTIVAPADGRVVALVNRPGDTVERFLPVVTVEEYRAEYVDVYVPETSGQVPAVGARVNLYPHRHMALDTTGVIVSVDPGYSMIPERLAFQGRFYWARKFRVKMAADHALMPGEAVRVELVDNTIAVSDAIASVVDSGAVSGQGAQQGTAQGAPQQQVPAPPSGPEKPSSGLKTITFIGLDGSRGVFEPSGAVWLADIERYLVVSDDTGSKGSRHAPWLFLMDRSGVVDPAPVVLAGVEELNDLEAVTMAPDGTVYLVSSNNANRKGVRKPERQQIMKVSREGRGFKVVAAAALADAVVKGFDGKALAVLGLASDTDGGLRELNIEGAAWVDGALMLGLKQPVADGGAILWRLENPDAFIESGELAPKQLTMYATVDFGMVAGRRAAISDLFRAADGTIYAASTIPGVPDSDQPGRVFHLDRADDGGLVAVRLAEYPGLKPEAVCQSLEGTLTVMFDTGSAPAKFTTLELVAK